jgi:hypothetical protein
MGGHSLQNPGDLTDGGSDDHHFCLPDPHRQIASGPVDRSHPDCILPGVRVSIDADNLADNVGSAQGHPKGPAD